MLKKPYTKPTAKIDMFPDTETMIQNIPQEIRKCLSKDNEKGITVERTCKKTD